MPTETVSPASGNAVLRLPPYSEEAEKGVLGSVLQDASIVDLAIENQLVPESFYVPAHRIVFDVLVEMATTGRPIDVLTVANRLKEIGKIDQIGGEHFLHRLIDSTPTTAHAGYYIDVVRQKRMMRSIIECARNAESACYSSDEDAFSLLGRVEQSFFSIADRQHGEVANWPDVVKRVMTQIETLGENTSAGIRTGFPDVDHYLGGLRPGNMIVLAARPSMGKTSLAMNVAENVARGHIGGGEPAPVGIFSLEMSQDDLVLRMLCTYARVSMHQIRDGRLGGRSDRHRSLVQAADVLRKAPVFLDDTAGLDVMELRSRARRMKKRHDVKLLIVDYLQLLNCREFTRQGRQIETSVISGNLKAMAKELGVPVLVLSQLSRAPEARGEGIPRLSDLRDSGSIEQDADIVLLLRRPCKYSEDPEHEDKRLAIIDIAKNRNGPTFNEIRLNFEEEFTRFDSRAEERGVDGFGGGEEDDVF